MSAIETPRTAYVNADSTAQCVGVIEAQATIDKITAEQSPAAAWLQFVEPAVRRGGMRSPACRARQTGGGKVSPVDKLLLRLGRVRKTAPGKWLASSPTRDDRSPSLAIRELDDGTVLLHDFGGDDVEAVLSAIGLEFSDLYPEKHGHQTKPTRRPWSAIDLIDLAAFESSVCVVITADLLAGKEDADRARLIEAARRLGEVAEAAHAR